MTAGESPSPVGEGWDGVILTAGVTPSPRGGRLGWDHPNNKKKPKTQNKKNIYTKNNLT